MDSPWHALPESAPFVLPSDEPYIAAFNARAKPQYQLHLEAYPEPFFGSFDAPIVVLLQNPGFSRDGQHIPEDENFIRRLRRYLRDGAGPHLHLASDAVGPGHEWWMRVTSQIRGASSRDKVASGLLSVEYFPYHSISFAHSHLRLPSQEFSFDLVREAIARESEIIVTRGFDSWVGAVPGLAAYSRACRLNSTQNSAMSANNLGSENFARIVHTLSRAGVV